MDEKKNKIGRPTKYDPAMCEIVVEVMEQGFSFEAVAGHLGICKDTLYEWAKKYPDFSDAKKRGLEQSRIFWEALGIEHIVTKSDSKTEKQGHNTTTTSKSRSLNSSVYIFNLKNRFGWSDKKEVELGGDDLNFTLNFNLDKEPEE